MYAESPSPRITCKMSLTYGKKYKYKRKEAPEINLSNNFDVNETILNVNS
jgi:hypothetical protein